MDQVQVPVQAHEASWKERCYARVESLKAKVYSPRSDVCWERSSTIFELQKAVQNGDVDNFIDVLEKVCSENMLALSHIFYQVTLTGNSLLHEAAHFGRAKIAELIGHYFPKLLTKRNTKLGDTPLHVAARATKSSDVIKVILSQYDAHAHKSTSSLIRESNEVEEIITRLTNHRGNTALHEAVCSKNLNGVTLLFEADERAAHNLNKSGISPLYLAVLIGEKEIVRVLLEAPFLDDKPLPNCQGNSPLHAAIYTKNAALMNEILGKKKELMYLTDEDGGTPLHYAATHGYVEGVHLLLKISTQTALISNTNGHLPIHLACKWGHLKVVKHLLKREWVDDSRFLVNGKGQNVLHIAAKNGRYNVRIDLNLVNNEAFTALDTFLLEMDLETPISFGQWLSKAIFHSVGAIRSDKARSILRKRKEGPREEWVKDRVNTLMMVAILIVTVTFAAGFTVPGGVYSSDHPNPSERGMAVLGNRTMFKIFVIFNTVAMYCSTLASITLMWTVFGDSFLARRTFFFVFRMVGVALGAMSLAFVAAVRLTVTNVSRLANLVTAIGIAFIFFIFSIIILATVKLGSPVPVLRQLNDFLIRIFILLYGSTPKIKSKKSSISEKNH